MTDNQKLMGGLLKLKETDQDGYLAMHAIFHAATGSESMPMPEGYSRGTFKRAIRRMRALKTEMEKDRPDCVPCLETAVTLIRRDWLHREG